MWSARNAPLLAGMPGGSAIVTAWGLRLGVGLALGNCRGILQRPLPVPASRPV